MKAYVLFGYARAPGMAGDWQPLAVVRAETIDDAARKIGGAIEDGKPGEENSFVRQKRQFLGRVIRAIIASKGLRGKKRREALRERKTEMLRRYDTFRLERMPAFR